MRRNGSVAYPVLESEIAKRGLKKYDIADAIGISSHAFSVKLNDRSEFTGKEMLKIWTKFFHDVDILELFNFKTGE